MSWLDWLFGKRPPSREVSEAEAQQQQDYADLGAAIKEVKRLKNGIIEDYEKAEQDRRKPR